MRRPWRRAETLSLPLPRRDKAVSIQEQGLAKETSDLVSTADLDPTQFVNHLNKKQDNQVLPLE